MSLCFYFILLVTGLFMLYRFYFKVFGRRYVSSDLGRDENSCIFFKESWVYFVGTMMIIIR